MNKKKLVEEIKEMLKVEGKEHLMDFAEELAETGWKVIKLVASQHAVGKVIVTALDETVTEMIDKIDGEEG